MTLRHTSAKYSISSMNIDYKLQLRRAVSSDRAHSYMWGCRLSSDIKLFTIPDAQLVTVAASNPAEAGTHFFDAEGVESRDNPSSV
jgi:hypothetical protein